MDGESVLSGFLRETPGGTGVAGGVVTVKLHSTDGAVGGMSDTTDADGFWDIASGYPGEFYVEVESGSVKKVQSSKITGFVGTFALRDLPLIFRAFTDGYVDGFGDNLAVVVNTGMSVTVGTGMGIIHGNGWYHAADENVTVTAADGSNDRIDLVVVRFTKAGNTDAGKREVVIIAGTPAGSPVAPDPLDTSTYKDLPLAEILVPTGTSSVTSDRITDRRVQASPAYVDGAALKTLSVATAALADNAVTTQKINDNTITSAKIQAGLDATKIGAGAVTNTEFGYLDGVTSAIQTQIDGKQPLDADLTALAALATTGVVTRTGAGTVAARTLTAGTGISISNGDGVAGNPTITATGALNITVQEGDSTVDAAVTTLDFDASDFNVTSSPAGEANIALAYGTSAGTPAEGDHTHSYLPLSGGTVTGDTNLGNSNGDVTTIQSQLETAGNVGSLTMIQGGSASFTSGNDTCGVISMTTPAGVGSGQFLKITFQTPRQNTTYCVFLWPADPDSGAANPITRLYQDHSLNATTDCTLSLPSGALLSNSTTYVFNFLIVGAQ
jgi:hypothetical protein